MLKRIARLFVIKTRFEAFLVTYAIAVGAIERGRHYLEIFPGKFGFVMAALCTGVVFIAGAKLLDATRPAPPKAHIPTAWKAPRRVSRSRPRQPRRRAATLPAALRTD